MNHNQKIIGHILKDGRGNLAPTNRLLLNEKCLFIVTSKSNKTHFEKRTRQPRPYESSSVK